MSAHQHRNALKPGHRIKWYEIRKVLGQGGFGITYLALDTNLDQEVAIKEYLPVEFAVRDGDHTVHPASGDHGERFEWGKDRFITEARTLAKFKHPNIVRVFSVFEAMNTAYMIMEYERGESLQEKLSGRRTLDEAELLDIALPVMDGLQCVHEAGFIHRDIKPANILVREDGSPVLLDFGSARQALGNATRTLTALVSPGYAPFEQYYSKSDEQGPWTDIYGLGATLYRAAAGVPPMDAMDRSRSLLESTPDTFIPTSSLTAGRYSKRFQRAVDHALRFKQSERPQSIVEWRRDFGIDQVVAELRRLESDQAAPTQPTRIVHPQGRQKPKRSRAPIAVIAGLAAVATGAYFGVTQFAPNTSQQRTAGPPSAGAGASSATSVPSIVAQTSTTVAVTANPIDAPVPGADPAPPASAAPPLTEAAPSVEAVTAFEPDPAPVIDAPAPDSAARVAPAAIASLAGTELDDAESQRIAALFAAAESERSAQDEATRLAEQAGAQAAEAARIADQARQTQAEQQRLATLAAEQDKQAQAERDEQQRREEAERAEAARLAEQQRLATLAAEQDKHTQAEREEQQRREEAERAEAARLAEQQRLAALAAEQDKQAQAERAETARLAEQQRLAALAAEQDKQAQAEREEQQRMLALQAQQQACKLQQAVVREPARAGNASYFAAIAVGAGNGWGEAWGYGSRNEAEQVALAGCLQNDTECEVQVWTNDCIAFATDTDGAAGWSWGASLNEARDKAIGFCESHSACCTVMTAYCADELGQ